VNHDNTVLSDKQIAELYMRMKSHDKDARKKLIESNIGLVGHIVKKYIGKNFEIDDLISVGCIGLIKAVDTYDITKGVTLCTYASKCITNEILMYLNKENRYLNNIEPDSYIDINEDGKEYIRFDNLIFTNPNEICQNCEMSEERKIIMEALATLNLVGQYIILMHYGFIDDIMRTQEEIGEKLGVTRSYVSRLEKKVLCKLRSIKSLQQLHECY
jgi:RNA polymerase sporulation-specific sigma factor